MNDNDIRKAIKEIVFDIQDRRGLKHEWNNIDEDIQEEIKESWFNIIKDSLKNN